MAFPSSTVSDFPRLARPLRRGIPYAYLNSDSNFLDDLLFRRLDGASIDLSNESELGLTLGIDRAFRLWLIRIDRVGVGYRFGDRLSSVRILFDAPF